jgi:hypothetical protein
MGKCGSGNVVNEHSHRSSSRSWDDERMSIKLWTTFNFKGTEEMTRECKLSAGWIVRNMPSKWAMGHCKERESLEVFEEIKYIIKSIYLLHESDPQRIL